MLSYRAVQFFDKPPTIYTVPVWGNFCEIEIEKAHLQICNLYHRKRERVCIYCEEQSGSYIWLVGSEI